MSNMLSVEIGWIITHPDHDDYPESKRFFDSILKDFPESDEVGYFVPGTRKHQEAIDPMAVLNLETHPVDCSRVFVSWCGLGHGWSYFVEPHNLGQVVREFIAKHDPEAIVAWGVIETER